MTLSFTRFSLSLWGSKKREPVSNGSTLNNSPSEWGFALKEAKGTKMAPSHRKVKRKWQSREERRIEIDREYDFVLVPSDDFGGCMSGSESDDSDWAIGWLEPHGSDFQCDDESDNSFAVLIRCYSYGCKEVEGSNNLGASNNLPNGFSSAGKNNAEQWLTYLQNFEEQKTTSSSVTTDLSDNLLQITRKCNEEYNKNWIA